MALVDAVFSAAFAGETMNPVIGLSTTYKHWESTEDKQRCFPCETMHGKIWLITETPEIEPPLHPHCRCKIKTMETIKAGTATFYGLDGAVWSLKNEGKIPDYYITDTALKMMGWTYGDKVSKFAPNKMITFDKPYENDDGHLPMAPERIWYEADINYKQGKRGKQRIVWSNDGLIFVTYDHYVTFYEII